MEGIAVVEVVAGRAEGLRQGVGIGRAETEARGAFGRKGQRRCPDKSSNGEGRMGERDLPKTAAIARDGGYPMFGEDHVDDVRGQQIEREGAEGDIFNYMFVLRVRSRGCSRL